MPHQQPSKLFPKGGRKGCGVRFLHSLLGLSPPVKDSLHRVSLIAADVRIKDWAAAICREGGSVCRSSSHLHPYIDAASG